MKYSGIDSIKYNPRGTTVVSVMMDRACSNCGKGLRDEKDLYCPNCGHKYGACLPKEVSAAKVVGLLNGGSCAKEVSRCSR